MNRIRIVALIALLPSFALAQHLITDPLTAGASGTVATHCGLSIDGAADVVTTVTPAAAVPAPNTPPAGAIVCYHDVSTLAPGSHTAKVNAQWIDPNGVYKTVVSAYSNVASFTVPGSPGAPTGERLIK